MAHDAGDGLQAHLQRGAFAHHHQRGGTVADAGRRGGGNRAVLFERRLQSSNLVELGLERLFVELHQRVAVLAGQGDRCHLPIKAAVFIRGLRTQGAGDGKSVLRFTREVVLGHALLGKQAHALAAFVGVFQPVQRHVVVDRAGAVLDALARKHQVRCIGHAFHATGHHHAGAARGQHVMAEHGRAHAAAAHLAQRHRASAVGQPRLAQRLACGCLALAGHQAVAEQHFIDGVAGHTGALYRRPYRHSTQFPGGQ